MTLATRTSDAPSSRIVENAPTRALLSDRGAAGPRMLQQDMPDYARFRASFTRPLLTRPAVLDAEQTRRLDHDLPLLLRTLQSLPDRLFDGDQEEFARALGWTQPSAVPALRLLSGPTVPLGRADLVRGADGFRLVEFNTSSSLGSMEFGELCRAVLADPSFRDVAETQGLFHLDPMALMADTLLERAGLDRAQQPTAALVDWVSSPFDVNASLFTELMAEQGFRIVSCTVADLECRADGLYAHGVLVDVVYRTFLFKTVAEDPQAAELLDPLSRAAREGLATVFSPLNADLFGSKACLAMLSDSRNRDRFTAEEREVLDRMLPWTRWMRGADTLPAEDGGSLADYVRQEREDLVLKPSIGHAGRGVVAGWLTEPAKWAELVRTACKGDFIVQRRAVSAAERFYAAGAEHPSACFLHWGMFVTGAGLSGGFVKGLLDHEQDIRCLGDGSHIGCVLHAGY